MFTTLYKLDSKGKVRQWTISCRFSSGYNVYPEYIIEHGLKDGKRQTKTQTVSEGKNIGRANETTIREQCLLEAQSKWTNQKDRKGYSEEIPTTKKFGPMLAKSYANPGKDLTDLKDGKHIKFPCYYQPKLDGIRCLASWEDGKVVLRSRRHKQFLSLPHIAKDLYCILSENQDVILDGELYIHNEDFQKLTSAIKRDEANDKSGKIEYHVYDYYDKNQPHLGFHERIMVLVYMFNHVGISIQRVNTFGINKHQVEEVWEANTKLGYEGIMLRNKSGPYKVDSRSQDLQKVKVFIDDEFQIVDAIENLKKPGTCTFWCVTEEGHPFKATPKGTQEQREQYWDDWRNGVINKGDQLTCRFFSWTTSKKSVPRMAIGICIRDYE